MRRPRVLLLCGGQSEEHEVSLASARSVLEAADGLEVTPVVIDRSGRLLDGPASARALESGRAPGGSGQNSIVELGRGNGQAGAFDVVFPILHGPNGEDGTVQGLLRLAGIPFVGSDILGSAVGMDKIMMKSVLAAHGFPQVRYRGVLRSEWRADPDAVLAGLNLELPVFAKPANLGSSVGITRAETHAQLAAALDIALELDRRAIVEEAVPDVRELEVAVLGNDHPRASVVGEISYDADFYDYDTKYQEGRAALNIPADVPGHVADRCRDLALEAFRALDLAGLARVDFFLQPATGELLLNEVNTMPGFTVTSMYPRLWAASGVGYGELVGRLVDLALERSTARG